jgi:hypothetical protein
LMEIGKYIKPIEKPIYKALGQLKRCFRGEVVSKGLNSQETAQLIAYKKSFITDCIILSWDMRKFDAHVRKYCLEYENSIFKQFFVGNDKEFLAKLLRWCIKNKCRAYFKDGVVKYTVDGGRMSGDMQTSLGACLIMVSLMIAFMEDAGVDLYDLLDNGDDILTFIQRKDLNKILNMQPIQWFERCGFRVKLESPLSWIEDIEFCHSHPIEYTKGKYIMVRNFPDSVIKDLTCLTSVFNKDQLLSWFTGIGKCGLSITMKVPILKSFYKFLLRVGSGKTSKINFFAHSGFLERSKDVLFEDDIIEDVARISFFKAFGIAPHEQIYYEHYYDGAHLDVDLCNVPIK